MNSPDNAAEAKVARVAARILNCLSGDEVIQDMCMQVANQEMRRLYGPDWDFDDAVVRMDPSESHYWSVYTAVWSKALGIVAIKSRHFLDEGWQEP
jgi:hypothetical protein